MKTREFAQKMKVHVKTVERWFHAGLIKVAYQLPTDTIIIPDDARLLTKDEALATRNGE